MKAVVLCASFAANPRPWLSAALGWWVGTWCFRLPVPAWVVRRLLAGTAAPEELVRAVTGAVASVNPDVLTHRLKEVMRVDATPALRNCPVEIFYLRATEDRVLGPNAVELVSSVRPDTAVIDIPGPHLLLQAKPELCAPHIAEVLNRAVS